MLFGHMHTHGTYGRTNSSFFCIPSRSLVVPAFVSHKYTLSPPLPLISLPLLLLYIHTHTHTFSLPPTPIPPFLSTPYAYTHTHVLTHTHSHTRTRTQEGVGGPTLVTDQTLGGNIATKGWMSYPKTNRMVLFDAK